MRVGYILPLVVLGGAALVTATIYGLGGGADPGPLDTRPDQAGIASEQTELLAAIRSLDQSVQSLTKRLDAMAVPVAKSVTPSEQPPGAATASNNPQIAELTAAIRDLLATQYATPQAAASVQALRWIVEQQPVRDPQNSLGRFKDKRSATDALLFKGYEQVLRDLGRPEEIVPEENRLRWFYDRGEVLFVDGFVISVNRYGDE